MRRSFQQFEDLFAKKISNVAGIDDPAHDLLHFRRVVASAKKIALEEGADLEVVVPAAWLHDLVIVAKNDPRRAQASQLSGEAAKLFLREIEYPEDKLDTIAHAIEAHSFSAGIEPRTLEAAIVQDADRLDGIGAIGIARCFATAGLLKRSFYSESDPFCEAREPNDLQFTIDHFYKKLFIVARSLRTKAGQAEGLRRLQRMQSFLNELKLEI